MDATCKICGKVWDVRDPGVRFVYLEGVWECFDESACFGRRAIARALESASAPLRVVE